MGQKITMVAKDDCNRGRAELTVERTLQWCDSQNKMRRVYLILRTWGCDFGDRTAFLELPIGKCDGVIAGRFNWELPQ